MYLSHSVYLLTMSCMKCLLTNSKMVYVTVDIGYFLLIRATLNYIDARFALGNCGDFGSFPIHVEF